MKTIFFRTTTLALSLCAGLAQTATQSVAAPSISSAANAASGAQLDANQIEEMRLRIQWADAILLHVEADAAQKGASKDWRMGLLSSLYATASRDLQSIASTASTLDAAQGMADAAYRQSQATASLAKSLGSASDNLVFTPVTPCRYIDTRNIGGPITTPRNFDTVLGGPSYGGASGCVFPGKGAPGIAVNVTVVVPAGRAGYLGFRPYGSSAVTSFINWPAEGTAGIANAGIIAAALNSDSSSYEFQAYAGGGNSPQVIVDYFGYFAAASTAAQALDCYDVKQSVTTTSSNAYQEIDGVCTTAGYLPVAPYCWNSGNTGVVAGGAGFFGATSARSVFCQFANNTGGSVTVVIGATCCRTAASP